MKIVFYSTNSNTFDKETFLIKVLPENENSFRDFVKNHPEHEFICVSQAPAMFLPESSVKLMPQESTALEVAEVIKSLKPDMAIAMTFWVSPYDWLTINDGLVAEELKKTGIKTICHSVETGLICFDKWKTHQFLLQNDFNVPKAIFADHDLYFCAGSHKEVINNIYKASIRSQLEELKLPIIIKDVAGLSSYGMTVVHTYGEAVGYLNSKRNNSNRIIEEYITGEQFGLEIYGIPGHYTVLPPFSFSLNQYGITSPKQSAKYGPCTLEPELKEMMLKLAEKLQLCGCAQVDLIKSEGKWFVIEINPRLSGMSFTSSVLCGKSIFEMLLETCVNNKILTFEEQKLLNLKLPILSLDNMKELIKETGIELLNQTNDLAARQEREKGFCECILKGKNLEEINQLLEKLKNLFPNEATILQSETILK